MASVEKPIESAQDIDQGEVVKVRRQAPEDADIEAFEEAQNTSWSDVARSCFCHSGEGWFKIFFGIGVVCFILYWFLIALELLGTSAKCLTGCLAGDLFFGGESSSFSDHRHACYCVASIKLNRHQHYSFSCGKWFERRDRYLHGNGSQHWYFCD